MLNGDHSPRRETSAVPDSVDFAVATGLNYAYGTTLYALKYRANIQPGETMLVGASIYARLTGALVCLVAGTGWRAMITGAPTHRSPNAGWPEAAFAAFNIVKAGYRFDAGKILGMLVAKLTFNAHPQRSAVLFR